jgi:serine/threonine protein kinase
MMDLRQIDELEEYDSFKKFAGGSFGQVYKVVRKSDRKVFAMKVMENPDKQEFAKPEDRELARHYIMIELLLMRNCYHPNVVKYKKSFITKAGDYAMVMEYGDNGTLTNMVEKNVKLSENKVIEEH